MMNGPRNPLKSHHAGPDFWFANQIFDLRTNYLICLIKYLIPEDLTAGINEQRLGLLFAQGEFRGRKRSNTNAHCS